MNLSFVEAQPIRNPSGGVAEGTLVSLRFRYASVVGLSDAHVSVTVPLDRIIERCRPDIEAGLLAVMPATKVEFK